MMKINCRKFLYRFLSVISFVFLCFLLFGLTYVNAATSSTINLEGKIVRSDTGYEGLNVTAGSPACVITGAQNDTCDFQVKYYSASTGGTLFLTETFTNVEIGQYGGSFNLLLGSGAVTSGTYSSLNSAIKIEDNVYVEINFSPSGNESYTEVFSRTQINSSVYAFNSKYADATDSLFLFESSNTTENYGNVAGSVYFDTTANVLKIYDGQKWDFLGSGSGSEIYLSEGTDGTNDWTYLTFATDDFVFGGDTYTSLDSSVTYDAYLLGLSSNPSLVYDSGAQRLTIVGDTEQSGLNVNSSFSGTNANPLISFSSTDSTFGSTVLEITNSGKGSIASYGNALGDLFAFETTGTMHYSQVTSAPSTVSDRLYNLNGDLYWNGVALVTTLNNADGLFKDAGTYTYTPNTAEDIMLGSTDPLTSSFYFDVSTGRLGIGTSNPQASIDIAGSDMTISNTSGDITITPAESLAIKVTSGTTDDNLLEWRHMNDSVLSSVGTDGTLSLGVASASALLSIDDNSATVAQVNFSASNDLNVSTTNVSDGDIWYNGTEFYFFDGNNNLNLLDVNTDRFIDGSITTTVNDGTSSVAFAFNTDGAVGDSGKLMSVMNNSDEKLYLDTNGNMFVSNVIATSEGYSVELINNSGDVVDNKSLVIVDESANGSFTLTNVAKKIGGYGVMVSVSTNGDVNGNGICDNGDSCIVAVEGSANVKMVNALNASVGDYVYSSTVKGSASSSVMHDGNGLVGVVAGIENASDGYVSILFDGQNRLEKQSTFSEQAVVKAGGYLEIEHNQESSDLAAIGYLVDEMFSSAWNGSSDTRWYTNHSNESVLYISTAEELAGLASLVNAGNNFSGKTVFLKNSIDLGGANKWIPIGTSSAAFAGVFDGNGYSVKNLYMDNVYTADVYVGLFGYSSGTIQNLGLESASIYVQDTGGNAYVGGIVGYNSGTVSYCYSNDGDIFGEGSRTLVAATRSTYVGGVVGYNSAGTIEYCFNTSSVHAYGSATSGTYIQYVYAGGVVGYSATTGASLNNCLSTGTVLAEGGVSTSSGSQVVSGGGVAGYISATSVSDSYSYSSVRVVGNGTSNGSDSSTTSTAIYSVYGGGLVGGAGSSSTIANSYSVGDVYAYGNSGVTSGTYSVCVGGVVGYISSSTISDSYNSGGVYIYGNIAATAGTYNLYNGGVVGYGTTGIVNDSYNNGSISGYGSTNASATGTYNLYVGGVLGGGYVTSSIGVVYNSGSVVAKGWTNASSATYNTCAGGVVGINSASTVSNAYNAGGVTGEGGATCYVGGVFGSVVSSATVSNTYNIGSLVSTATTTSYIGGVVGYDDGSDTISNNYWLNGCGATYGRGSASSSTGANGRNDTVLQGLSGTLGTAFFDDTRDINGGYPILSGAGVNYVLESSTKFESWLSQFGFSVSGNYSYSTALSVWDGTVDTSWYDVGSHTFYISTAEELAGLAAIVNGTADGVTRDSFANKTVYLTKDVDLGAKWEGDEGESVLATGYHSWTPIGDYSSSVKVFSGTFDGGGHTVRSLFINSDVDSSNDLVLGLFGYVSGGSVKNIGVVESSIYGRNSGGNVYVGSIAGVVVNGYVGNCFNTGTMSAEGSRTLVNANRNTLVGGLVANSDTSVIENSYNTGYVHCYGAATSGTGIQNTYAGGIVANSINSGAKVFNCFNTGDVLCEGGLSTSTDATWDYRQRICSGGIVGTQEDYGEVNNCYNSGVIKSVGTGRLDGSEDDVGIARYDSYVGGVVGDNASSSSVSECYNVGSVTAYGSTGSATGTYMVYVGGVVGDNASSSSVSECYNVGSVTAYGSTGSATGSYYVRVGGVVGDNASSSSVSECYNVGSVLVYGSSGSATGTYCVEVGGVVGYNASSSSVSECYNIGDVTVYGSTNSASGSYNVRVGGVVGGDDLSCSVNDCYNVGDVTVYGYKDVTGTGTYTVYVGGVIGNHNASTITKSYNTGSVSSSSGTTLYTGGVIGYVSGTNTITTNYWLSTCGATYGIASSSVNTNATSITSADLKNLVSTLGSTVWTNGDADTNNGYPILIGLDLPQYTFDEWLSMYDSDNPENYNVYEVNRYGFYDYDIYDVWDGTVDTSWYNTTSTSFNISTAEELAGLASIVNAGTDTFDGKSILLVYDVYLGNYVWSSIGNSTNMFKGDFNGNGHVVRGMYINNSDSSSNNVYFGLFGYVDSSVISNLGIGDSYVYVSNNGSGNTYVGGISGYISNSSVSNCYVVGEVVSESDSASGTYYSGGMVGYSNISTFDTVYSNGSSKVNNNVSSYVGGMVGYLNGGSVNNAYNIGYVSVYNSGGDLYDGGIVGYGNGSDISYCYNSGELYGKNDGGNVYVAGVSGYSVGIDISYCGNSGSVYGEGSRVLVDATRDTWVAGITAMNDASVDGSSSNVRYSYNTGSIHSYGCATTGTGIQNTYAGGVVGKSIGNSVATSSAVISNCFNTGEVLVEGGLSTSINDWTYVQSIYCGGIVGYNYNSGEISDCFNEGVIKGVGNGKLDGSDNGNVAVGLHSIQLGGIVGYNYNFSTVSKSCNVGTVIGYGSSANTSGSYYTYIGGVVGVSNFCCEVSECYSVGNVSVHGSIGVVDNLHGLYIGGIVGLSQNSSCNISKCYNVGSVTVYGSISGASDDYWVNVGGVVGWNNTSCSVSECYNVGSVTVYGSTSGASGIYYLYIGGVVGVNYNSCSVSECYNVGSVLVYGSTGSATGNYNVRVGGVVGNNQNSSSVSECYNVGSVLAYGSTSTASGGYLVYVGGVVGLSYGESTTYATVSNSYNNGNVTGYGYYGVTGTGTYGVNVGGVVGYSTSSATNNTYNVGTVSVSNGTTLYKGGVIGNVAGSNTISNNYWLSTCGAEKGIASTAVDTEATPKTSTEMQAEVFVTSLNNGGTAWLYDSDVVNNGYPILSGIDYNTLNNGQAETMDLSKYINEYYTIENTNTSTEYKTFISSVTDDNGFSMLTFNTWLSDNDYDREGEQNLYPIEVVDDNTIRIYNLSDTTRTLRLNVYFNDAKLVLLENSNKLLTAPATAQIDYGEGNSLWIDKYTSTSGSLLKLQTGGEDMMTVDNYGNVVIAGDLVVDTGVLTLGAGIMSYNTTTGTFDFGLGETTSSVINTNTSKFTISAEYAGSVYSADGTNNTGNMTRGVTGTANKMMGYYEWNSSETTAMNDYDIRIRTTLPSDFSTWGGGGITLSYVTESTTATNNKMDFYVYEENSTLVDGYTSNNVSTIAGTWATTKIEGLDLEGCNEAGDVCVLVIKLSSLNDNYVRVGDITFEYNRAL